MLDETFSAIDENSNADQLRPEEKTSPDSLNTKEDPTPADETEADEKPNLEQPDLEKLEDMRRLKSRTEEVDQKSGPSKKDSISEKQVSRAEAAKKFYGREKHLFILTWAGRPVYSRYGDETDLASFMGVVSTIINIVNVNQNDSIRCVKAGLHKFVFLVKGPVYLLVVTRTHESVYQLRCQMEYIFEQLTGILTSGVFDILNQRPQYDMRNLIGRNDRLLIDNLIIKLNHSPAYLLHAYSPLQVPKAVRDDICQIIRHERRSVRKKEKDSWASHLMFGLLMVDGHPAAVFQPKKHPLHPQDVLLLQHFIAASEPFRQSETWTPICLPKFERKGFMYAYVHYMTSSISLTLVTKDPQSFHHLSECRKRIESRLQSRGHLTKLMNCLNNHPFKVSSMGIPHLLHFVYYNVKKQQYIEPVPLIEVSKSALFRRIQHLHDRVHSNPDHPILFERSRRDCLLAKVVPGELEALLFFNAFSSKKHAALACNRVLTWIHNRHEDLFTSHTAW